jgi:hypothetical protein
MLLARSFTFNENIIHTNHMKLNFQFRTSEQFKPHVKPRIQLDTCPTPEDVDRQPDYSRM